MTQPIRVLLLGAGNRGADVYGEFIRRHPDLIQLVAVAEPDTQRRERCAATHHIPPENRFETWSEALRTGRLADAVINATPDDEHHNSAIAALQAGYDQLLEKPIATTLGETLNIIRESENLGRILMVCHVLRYTDFFQKVKAILDSGQLGQLIHISHSENVSYSHMAHSYVRGNWRNTSCSAPMIVAKCCHDLDLLDWFMGEKCTWLSSAGSLRHFIPENAPSGAPDRCTDGCPAAKTCPYFAPGIYIDSLPIKQAVSKAINPLISRVGKLCLYQPRLASLLGKVIPPVRVLSEYSGWPRNTITDHPHSDQAVLDALRSGPYGLCVYRCDNNVVDHQVVSMVFESGITATLTMHGHSHEEARTLRIDGSRATLLGKFSYSQAWLEMHGHLAGAPIERYTFPTVVDNASGHGGGDDGVMHRFIKVMCGEKSPSTSAWTSLESHLLGFAAEAARVSGKAVDMTEFRCSSGV